MTSPVVERTGDGKKGGESRVWSIVLLAGTFLFILLGVVLVPHGAGRDLYKSLLGVIVTLGIFSILYKENPIFSFLEHIFIGLAAGYGVVATWYYLLVPKWWDVMYPQMIRPSPQTYVATSPAPTGQWWLILALLLGTLFFTVYLPRLAWMNRLMIGVLMGWAAGAALQMFMGGLAPQIVAAFKPPLTSYAVTKPALPGANQIDLFDQGTTLWTLGTILAIFVLLYGAHMASQRWAPKAVDFIEAVKWMLYIALGVLILSFAVILCCRNPANPETMYFYLHPWWLIEFVVLVCVLAYFFYSVQHKHVWIRVPANAGRYLLMISLGAIFGTTVMSRFTLLIGVLSYLITTVRDWWGMLIHAMGWG
jgi:hypothetical protein